MAQFPRMAASVHALIESRAADGAIEKAQFFLARAGSWISDAFALQLLKVQSICPEFPRPRSVAMATSKQPKIIAAGAARSATKAASPSQGRSAKAVKKQPPSPQEAIWAELETIVDDPSLWLDSPNPLLAAERPARSSARKMNSYCGNGSARSSMGCSHETWRVP
jgi:hypothetical protein